MQPRNVSATQRIGSKSASAGRFSAATGPTEDQIRRRAYEIYVARGGAGGTPESDWRQAEQELRGRMALLNHP